MTIMEASKQHFPLNFVMQLDLHHLSDFSANVVVTLVKEQFSLQWHRRSLNHLHFYESTMQACNKPFNSWRALVCPSIQF